LEDVLRKFAPVTFSNLQKTDGDETIAVLRKAWKMLEEAEKLYAESKKVRDREAKASIREKVAKLIVEAEEIVHKVFRLDEFVDPETTLPNYPEVAREIRNDLRWKIADISQKLRKYVIEEMKKRGKVKKIETEKETEDEEVGEDYGEFEDMENLADEGYEESDEALGEEVEERVEEVGGDEELEDGELEGYGGDEKQTTVDAFSQSSLDDFLNSFEAGHREVKSEEGNPFKDPSKALFKCRECGAEITGADNVLEHFKSIHNSTDKWYIWTNVEELAVKLDDRTAVLYSDGYLLRLTPPGQPTVEQLVRVGDIIRINYGNGICYVEKGKVVGVGRYEAYGLLVYSINYVYPDEKPMKNGRYRRLKSMNELVAQDGRILGLFYNNKAEVFVVKKVEEEELNVV